MLKVKTSLKEQFLDWLYDLPDYLYYWFLSKNNQFYPVQLPDKTRLDIDEYLDLEYYHNAILRRLKVNNSINIRTKVIDLKKHFLLRTLGPYHKGYVAVMKLSYKFWNEFNFVQILFIASMYNQYPILLTGYKKPIAKLNTNTHYWQIVNKNKYNIPYNFHSMDCFRLTIANLGLATSLEYGFANYNNFYYTHATKKLFPELSNNMLDCFDLHCAELKRYNYHPTSQFIHSAKSAYHLLRVGDVIYSNPLDYEFQNWSDMSYKIQLQLQLLAFTKVNNDMKTYQSQSTLAYDIPFLINSLMKYLSTNTDVSIGNLSNKEIMLIHQSTKSNLTQYFAQSRSFNEIQAVVDCTQAIINEIIYKGNQLKKTLNLRTPQNQVILAKRSKFHVCTVLDINEDNIFVTNIDGGNPLLPMSIVNFDCVSRDMDKVVIFRL